MVFTAAGKDIYAWRRGTELKHVYSGHEHPVNLMMPFGPNLISIDTNSNMKVWDIKTEKLVLEFEFSNTNFKITSIVHPATYLNKILLGSEQGTLQLWNLKSGEKIYKFCGWGSAVLCLEQAPALDVVAVGLASGDIIVHNLKFDESIVRFSQDWGPVTGLAFRTDGPPMLISSSSNGHLALWDLEEKRMAAQTRDAHCAEITGIKCLQGEPLMLTSSPDNTLKQVREIRLVASIDRLIVLS
jgi:U3 small nucleolar RNA-associated protein 21